MTSIRMARAAACLCLAAVAASPAAAAPSLVVDARSGEVISSEEATRPWNPASTTKMMTAYVALKAVRDGRIGWETPIPVSRVAAGQRPSKLGVRPGTEITLENALRVMMVKSANDLAVVVAEGVGGSLPNFVALMNAEAARLGMRESHFLTPHGFHQPGQRTSARDLAILARALYNEFPEHRDLWSTGAVQVGQRIMRNTNGLIGRYPGAEGMKTGFVCASGFNLVGLATRGGRTLIAVVLGAGSGSERSVKTAQMLDRGFASWSTSGQTLASLPGSGYESAPDMRAEICRRGRGVILSDEADDVALTPFYESLRSSDNYNSVMEGIRGPGPMGRASGSVVRRNANGQVAMAPRAEFVPVQITLGRTAGSAVAPLAANVSGARPQPTMVARGKPDKLEPAVAVAPAARAPAAPAVAAAPPPAPPAETTAFAPAPLAPTAPVAASAGGLGAIGALFSPFASRPEPSAPLALHEPEEVRPGAAAAIRPKPAVEPRIAAPVRAKAKAKPKARAAAAPAATVAQ